MVQTGKNEGAKLQLRIKFRSDDLEGFVERYGSDVSPGGIFIRSKQPLPVGTRVLFHFSSMNGDPLLVGEGTIVWVRQPEGEQGGGNPGMGIRFDSLDNDSRARLGRILEGKTAREKSGRPAVRGPTPIPDGPFSGMSLSASAPDATAKVRLTADGRIVPDMPVPKPIVQVPSASSYSVPVPSPSGPAPSMPYASSLSNPQFSLPAAPTVRPSSEIVRRSTPALGTESSPQPFGPSKTLGSSAGPMLGPGGEVVRSQSSLPPRTVTPSFGTDVTRGAGGGAFSSTVAFGQEPTRQRSVDEQLRSEPTRGGMTPGPDLLRKATPPPIPLTPPPSVFSRPTPIPGVPLSELRSGSRSGPVVSRPTASRPAFVEPVKPSIDPGSAAAWSADKTEVVEDFPRFDETEEKTTTVRGQVLSAAEGFGSMPLTRPEIPNRLTPQPPAPTASSTVRPLNEGATKSFPVLPVLSDLFDGEALPGPDDPPSLLTSSGPDTNEFGSVESTARGRMVTPAPGMSMVARKVETTEFRVEKRRPFLWMVFAAVAVTGSVVVVVTYLDSNRNSAATAPAVQAQEPTLAPAPEAPAPAAPSPVPAPEAAAAAKELPESEIKEEAKAPAAAQQVVAAPAAPAAEPRVAAPNVQLGRPGVAKPMAVAPRPAVAPVVAKAPVDPPTEPDTKPTPPAAAIIDDDVAEAAYWLRVRSVPPGADVFVDGELEGQTPFQRRIFDSSRPYAVSIRKEGFETNDRMISSSDPWAKVKDEYSLTVSVKLRKSAVTPEAAPPAEPAAPAPEAAPSP
jgi:uncharacterized protein (TIGR02266 family)